MFFELATYDCLCEKYEFSKCRPRISNDYPCVWLTVIAKASSLNSNGVFVGIIGTRDNSTSLNLPFQIAISTILLIVLFTESPVRLASRDGSIIHVI